MNGREHRLVKTILNAINHAFGRSRLIQQTPILPDVWAKYIESAVDGGSGMLSESGHLERHRIDLLLTLSEGAEPGAVARTLTEGIRRLDGDTAAAHIASNRTNVAARLTFRELVCIVVPMTRWWQTLPSDLQQDVPPQPPRAGRPFKHSTEIEFMSFATTIGLLAQLLNRKSIEDITGMAEDLARQSDFNMSVKPLLRAYQELKRKFKGRDWIPEKASVARVQLNRAGYLAVTGSRQTIKADACLNLFKVSASRIRWAVLDCGIDARHDAFLRQASGKAKQKPAAGSAFDSRIVATYDFSNVRALLSGSAKVSAAGRKLTEKEQTTLAAATSDGQVDWGLLRRLTKIEHKWPGAGPRPAVDHYRVPSADHGTHVAGIIGADWPADPNGKAVIGICPDIELVDIRVFDGDKSDEFSVITALQFVGFLNRVSDVPYIHGINLSFSFAHDVRNFACGRTPICVSCERLVDNGVVVVAAAGNAGYGQVHDQPTLDDRYAQMTITDPGNAEAVITVGATHRTQPHAYGVSFFSSRGPTGDGRVKPDLIAPGEKILSTVPDNQSAEKDGTSMAAPHVSGAAAILMARHPELIGKARDIKRILCSTATDLGRERYFQGAGLLDILRALQSV